MLGQFIVLGQIPVSVASALLPSKHNGLRALRAECLDLHLVPMVLNIVADFERGIHEAVTIVLGGSFYVYGCFFHL